VACYFLSFNRAFSEGKIDPLPALVLTGAACLFLMWINPETPNTGEPKTLFGPLPLGVMSCFSEILSSTQKILRQLSLISLIGL